jgi:uncharacterized protein (UPF0276 family)
LSPYKTNKNIQGVGLNLRLETIDEFLEQKPNVSLLEVIVDNWLSPGAHHKKLEKIRMDYPISFHCVGMNIAGTDKVNDAYLRDIKKLKEKFEPIHISDHLCVTAHAKHQHHDLLPFPLNDAYLENTVERVSYIQDYLNETILLENLSYYVEYKSSHMSEIEFLEKLSNQTSCSYLLDLNNIWVNQQNLDTTVADYLKLVDWEKVKEVHVAGPEKVNGIYVDTHGTEIYPELLTIIESYRNHLKKVPVIYERDNNILELQDLILQKEKIKKAING